MNRMQLLNLIANVRGLTSYLEIGCRNNTCFDAVKLADKVGVDPQSGGTLRMASDQFFAVNARRFGLVFIDGLHLREQVLKDVDNALNCLEPGGGIVLHDCLPTEEWHQERTPRPGQIWTGDVWKAMVELRARPDLDAATLNQDLGCGIVFKRPNTARVTLPENLEWQVFQKRRNELLRVIGIGELMPFIHSP